MADENDAGAAYLAALRQSTAHGAAGAAPARARDAPNSSETQLGAVVPPGKTNPGSPNKRNSPRYKCAGSARIQEPGATVATWATFADISMHGCYVETAAPPRVGAVLRLKLDANGFRIEATGEVRVIYPGLDMGVSFIKMAEEDRQRLRDLMRSISPPSVILGQRVTARAPSDHQPNPSPGCSEPGRRVASHAQLLRRPPHNGPRGVSQDSAKEPVTPVRLILSYSGEPCRQPSSCKTPWLLSLSLWRFTSSPALAASLDRLWHTSCYGEDSRFAE